MANCPLHRLAREHADLVCGVGLRPRHGAVDSVKGASYRLDLDPAPIVAAGDSSPPSRVVDLLATDGASES